MHCFCPHGNRNHSYWVLVKTTLRRAVRLNQNSKVVVHENSQNMIKSTLKLRLEVIHWLIRV